MQLLSDLSFFSLSMLSVFVLFSSSEFSGLFILVVKKHLMLVALNLVPELESILSDLFKVETRLSVYQKYIQNRKEKI